MKKLAVLILVVAFAGCKEETVPQPMETPVRQDPVASPPANAAPVEPARTEPAKTEPAAPALAPIAIPADGKLQDVKVNGLTVPMINIMDGGTVVLVDTDGNKPRSWEEQYKRKGDLPKGYFNLHKKNANKNDTFEDDEIDQQGRWKMDEKGNIVQD